MKVDELIRADAEVIAKSDIDWDTLTGKTVLISGATGYVSQYVVHALMMRNELKNSDIKVIAMCRSKEKADARFSQYYDSANFRLLIQDIFDEVNIEDGIDYIIHTASPAGLVVSNRNPVETFKVNVMGCDNLLALAEKKRAQVLLFSSVDVYGKGLEGRFIESTLGQLDTTDIRNVYAYGKRAAENLAICYTQRGVSVKIVRPSQIMGGGIALNDGRIHIDFISQILDNNKIILKGDGSPVRSFIYMTDAITGILTVLTKGESGQAYNVCNEDGELSVLDFAKVMAACVKQQVDIDFNMETRKNNAEVKHAISVVTASSVKLRSLGWRPIVSTEEACKKMLSYYGVETK